MRVQTLALLFGGVVLIGAAFLIRFQFVPPIPSADDETLWGVAIEHARFGDAEQALYLANRIRNPDTREVALQSVADILIERSDFQSALRIVRSLPDPYLRILYFSNFVQSGKLPKSEIDQIVKEAERDAKRLKNEHQKKFAWLSVCRMWMKLGDVERAWEVAQNLPKTQMRHSLWGELAVTFAQKGDVKRALKIAAQLPDRWQEEAERPVSPFNLSVTIRQRELLTDRQSVLKAIAETLTEQGKVEEAVKIAQSLENEAIRSQVLDALADARKRIGMPPIMTDVSEKTLQFTQKLEYQLGVHGLFQPLRSALEEQIRLSKALNEARKLTNPEAKVDRLVQIAHQFSYYKAQRKEDAFAILGEATHYAREIKSPTQKLSALEKIAMCWERLGELEKAKELKDEAERMRRRVFETWRLKQDIAMKAATKGDLTELKELIKKAPDPIVADMLLRETVIKLARSGRVKDALALVNEMAVKDYHRQSLIGQIVWALVDAGKAKDALSLVRQLPAGQNRVSLYIRIAEAFRRQGQKERAIEMLKEALAVLSSLTGDWRKFELMQIACSFARLGETQKAMEIFNRPELRDLHS
ncbi:MAG: tetratricopeptide repeat protein, partial [Armatimonadota bacterium]